MNMKRKNTIVFALFLLLTCVCINVKAQFDMINTANSTASCFEIGLSGGLCQYRGEYHPFMEALKNFDYKTAFGFSVKYNFNRDYVKGKLTNIFDRRVSILLGTKILKASSNNNTFGDVMTMDILELNALCQVNILKYSSFKGLRDDSYHFTPYFEFGLAYSGFKCDNIIDLSATPADRYTDASYKYHPSAVFGAGLKMNLLRGITMAVDASARFTTVDDVDHNKSAGTRNDQYYFVGAELFFNLGEIFSRR